MSNFHLLFFHFHFLRRPAQSLIELLIAVGAISAVLVAMASVSTRAVSVQTSARTETQATQLLEQQIERLRVYRDRNGYAGTTGLTSLSCPVPSAASGCAAAACNVNSAYAVTTTGAVVTNGISVCIGTTTSGSCPGTQIQATAMAQWIDARGTHRPTLKTCLTGWAR